MHESDLTAEPVNNAPENGTESSLDRRRLLRTAGLAAAGAAAASVLSANPASAANNDPVLVGNTHTGTATTRLNQTSGSAQSQGIFAVADASDSPNTAGLNPAMTVRASSIYATALAAFGQTTGIVSRGDSAAIKLQTNSATAVHLKLSNNVAIATPTGRSSATAGTVVMDNDENLWFASESYSSGDPVRGWRKLAGPNTAGSFHPVNIQRVWDSRPSVDPAGTGMPGGVMTNGQTALINLASFIPVGTTAVQITVSAYQPAAEGILTAYRADISFPGTFISCYYSANVVAANTTTVPVSPARQIRLRCTQLGGSTIASVDLNGYYL